MFQRDSVTTDQSMIVCILKNSLRFPRAKCNIYTDGVLSLLTCRSWPEIRRRTLIRAPTTEAAEAMREVFWPSIAKSRHETQGHLLNPCSKDLLDKPTGSQLVKKSLAFHGTRRFITAFTSAATCPYPEPARSSPYPHILLPKDPS